MPGMPSSASSVMLTDQYDAVGNRTVLRTKLNDTPDFWNQYTYDHLDRLVGLAQNGAAGTNKSVGFVYDDAGHLIDLYRYNQAVTNPADPTDLGNATTPLATSVYGRDATGRLRTLAEQLADTTTFSYGWHYDQLNRLTVFDGLDNSYTPTEADYTYDDTNQLTDVTGNPTETFTYDANGNRLSDTYGPVSQAGGNQLDNDNTYEYHYDAEGNLTERTEKSSRTTLAFTYDYRNRLVRVDTHFGAPWGSIIQTVNYTYDTFNHRVSRTLDSDGNGQANEIENYIYDGDHVIFDFVDPDGVGRRWSDSGNPAPRRQQR